MSERHLVSYWNVGLSEFVLIFVGCYQNVIQIGTKYISFKSFLLTYVYLCLHLRTDFVEKKGSEVYLPPKQLLRKEMKT